MALYTSTNYKDILRARLFSLKQKKANWSFKRIAEHLDIQYTYFSKVMNSDHHHFSDDDLFAIGKFLQFTAAEIDFLQSLKSFTTTTNADRKNVLKVKIERFQKDKSLDVDEQRSSSSAFSNEVEYLLNPLCVVIHVALMSKTLNKDVRALAPKLGIKLPKLREYLKILEKNGLLKQDPQDPWSISEVKNWRTHFHRDHPLVRTSQNLIRQLALSRMSLISEEEKQSLNFSFTMDTQGFEKLKIEFKTFLKSAEAISKSSQHSEVYQMNFDLFKWL